MGNINSCKLTFIDLFAGAGGLSEGFVVNGFIPIAHIEMNPEAADTLKTRMCYHWLKDIDSTVYQEYLRGEVSREQLYQSVPESILNSVINKKMSEENLSEVFNIVDKLMAKNTVSNIDLVVGGPPCQAYSLVGRARSEDNMVNDPRNHLYKLYCRFLQKYQPRMFVFENVPGLLNANKGLYFSQMQQYFRTVGYELEYRVLNASDFGVLQNRLRVILVGWRRELNLYYPEFNMVNHSWVVGDLLDDLPSLQAGESDTDYSDKRIKGYLKEFLLRTENDILTWHVARPHIERDRKIYRLVINAWQNEHKRLKYTDLPEELCTHNNRTAFLDRFKVVARDLPACHTITAHLSKDGHYFIHPDYCQARSISVREAARIQSFPDNFFFEGSRTAAFTQIGNAVPPLMARGIADAIRKILS